jgi:hypothetical protein
MTRSSNQSRRGSRHLLTPPFVHSSHSHLSSAMRSTTSYSMCLEEYKSRPRVATVHKACGTVTNYARLFSTASQYFPPVGRSTMRPQRRSSQTTLGLSSRSSFETTPSNHNGRLQQVDGSVRWLFELGVYGQMTKWLVIDLDKSCSVRCLSYHTSGPGDPDHMWSSVDCAISVLSLLKHIQQHLELEVEFVHPRGKAHRDFHPGTDPNQ